MVCSATLSRPVPTALRLCECQDGRARLLRVDHKQLQAMKVSSRIKVKRLTNGCFFTQARRG